MLLADAIWTLGPDRRSCVTIKEAALLWEFPKDLASFAKLSKKKPPVFSYDFREAKLLWDYEKLCFSIIMRACPEFARQTFNATGLEYYLNAKIVCNLALCCGSCCCFPEDVRAFHTGYDGYNLYLPSKFRQDPCAPHDKRVWVHVL